MSTTAGPSTLFQGLIYGVGLLRVIPILLLRLGIEQKIHWLMCGTLLKLSVPIQVVEKVMLYIFLGPGTKTFFIWDKVPNEGGWGVKNIVTFSWC